MRTVQIGETPLSVGEGRRAAGLKPLCLPRTHSLEDVCYDILSVVSEVDKMIHFFGGIRGLHFSNINFQDNQKHVGHTLNHSRSL